MSLRVLEIGRADVARIPDELVYGLLVAVLEVAGHASLAAGLHMRSRAERRRILERFMV